MKPTPTPSRKRKEHYFQPMGSDAKYRLSGRLSGRLRRLVLGKSSTAISSFNEVFVLRTWFSSDELRCFVISVGDKFVYRYSTKANQSDQQL